jgi:hypothetical protein
MKHKDNFEWLERSHARARAWLAASKPKTRPPMEKSLYPKLAQPVAKAKGVDQSACASAQVGPRNTTRAVW